MKSVMFLILFAVVVWASNRREERLSNVLEELLAEVLEAAEPASHVQMIQTPTAEFEVGKTKKTLLERLARFMTKDKTANKAMTQTVMADYGIQIGNVIEKFDTIKKDNKISADEIREYFQNYDQNMNSVEDTKGIKKLIKLFKKLRDDDLLKEKLLDVVSSLKEVDEAIIKYDCNVLPPSLLGDKHPPGCPGALWLDKDTNVAVAWPVCENTDGWDSTGHICESCANQNGWYGKCCVVEVNQYLTILGHKKNRVECNPKALTIIKERKGTFHRCEKSGNHEHDVDSFDVCKSEALKNKAWHFSYYEAEKTCYWSRTCKSLVVGTDWDWRIWDITVPEYESMGNRGLEKVCQNSVGTYPESPGSDYKKDKHWNGKHEYYYKNTDRVDLQKCKDLCTGLTEWGVEGCKFISYDFISGYCYVHQFCTKYAGQATKADSDITESQIYCKGLCPHLPTFTFAQKATFIADLTKRIQEIMQDETVLDDIKKTILEYLNTILIAIKEKLGEGMPDWLFDLKLPLNWINIISVAERALGWAVLHPSQVVDDIDALLKLPAQLRKLNSQIHRMFAKKVDGDCMERVCEQCKYKSSSPLSLGNTGSVVKCLEACQEMPICAAVGVGRYGTKDYRKCMMYIGYEAAKVLDDHDHYDIYKKNTCRKCMSLQCKNCGFDGYSAPDTADSEEMEYVNEIECNNNCLTDDNCYGVHFDTKLNKCYFITNNDFTSTTNLHSNYNAYLKGKCQSEDCSDLPQSVQGDHDKYPQMGCAGAVWSSGSPSDEYCKDETGRHPWYKQCCTYEGTHDDGQCKPKDPMLDCRNNIHSPQGGAYPSGCAGAVWSTTLGNEANASPNKDICEEINSGAGKYGGWYEQCCKFEDNQCKPIILATDSININGEHVLDPPSMYSVTLPTATYNIQKDQCDPEYQIRSKDECETAAEGFRYKFNGADGKFTWTLGDYFSGCMYDAETEEVRFRSNEKSAAISAFDAVCKTGSPESCPLLVARSRRWSNVPESKKQSYIRCLSDCMDDSECGGITVNHLPYTSVGFNPRQEWCWIQPKNTADLTYQDTESDSWKDAWKKSTCYGCMNMQCTNCESVGDRYLAKVSLGMQFYDVCLQACRSDPECLGVDVGRPGSDKDKDCFKFFKTSTTATMVSDNYDSWMKGSCEKKPRTCMVNECYDCEHSGGETRMTAGDGSVESCKNLCQKDQTCVGIDVSPYNGKCFFVVSTYKIASEINDLHYEAWKKSTNCEYDTMGRVGFKKVCINSQGPAVSPGDGYHQDGGLAGANEYYKKDQTLEQCKDLCTNLTEWGCKFISWDSDKGVCYVHKECSEFSDATNDVPKSQIYCHGPCVVPYQSMGGVGEKKLCNNDDSPVSPGDAYSQDGAYGGKGEYYYEGQTLEKCQDLCSGLAVWGCKFISFDSTSKACYVHKECSKIETGDSDVPNLQIYCQGACPEKYTKTYESMKNGKNMVCKNSAGPDTEPGRDYHKDKGSVGKGEYYYWRQGIVHDRTLQQCKDLCTSLTNPEWVCKFISYDSNSKYCYVHKACEGLYGAVGTDVPKSQIYCKGKCPAAEIYCMKKVCENCQFEGDEGKYRKSKWVTVDSCSNKCLADPNCKGIDVNVGDACWWSEIQSHSSRKTYPYQAWKKSTDCGTEESEINSEEESEIESEDHLDEDLLAVLLEELLSTD